MTRYFVESNGERSKPFPGLNGVAEELVERWLVNPDPDIRVEAREKGSKRPLTANEHDGIVRQLVTLAQAHRASQPSMDDLYRMGVFG